MGPVTIDLLQALMCELRKSGALNQSAIDRVANVAEIRSITATNPEVIEGLHVLAEHLRQAGKT